MNFTQKTVVFYKMSKIVSILVILIIAEMPKKKQRSIQIMWIGVTFAVACVIQGSKTKARNLFSPFINYAVFARRILEFWI